MPRTKKAKLYIPGEVVDGICYGENNGKLAKVLFFKLLSRRFKGEKVIIHEYGDKFME